MSDASDLATIVQTAIDAATLKDLTNQRNPDANSIDSAVLLQACSFALGDFASQAGTTYDGTIAAHQAIAKDLAMVELCKNAFAWPDADSYQTSAARRIEQLKDKRVQLAATNSPVTVETPTETPVRFDFTESEWDEYRID